MSTIVAQAPEGMYITRVNATDHMHLQTSATQIDYYPVGTGKRFVKRVIWHPTAEISQQMTSFSTRTKSDMIYDVNQYIANGASVVDFNLNEYTGKDYSPVYC